MPLQRIRFLWPALRAAGSAILFTVGAIVGEFALEWIPLSPPHEGRIAHGLHICVILGVCWIVFRGAQTARDLLYNTFDTSPADNIRQRRLRTQIDFLYRIALILISLAGLATILLTFESARKFGASMIASAGVASIVIGFAAQKSLSNLIAGFQIAFTQPMRLDDVLIVENEWGRVEEITLTYVVVRLWDLRRMVLPITYFLEKPFQNWTRTSAEILGYSFLYVDYRCPLGPLRKEFERITRASPLWNGQVCILQVTNLSERTMELRALVSARNASEAFDLRCELREKLVAFLVANYPESLPQTRGLVQATFDAAPTDTLTPRPPASVSEPRPLS